jgi:hypothetical protein
MNIEEILTNIPDKFQHKTTTNEVYKLTDEYEKDRH